VAEASHSGNHPICSRSIEHPSEVEGAWLKVETPSRSPRFGSHHHAAPLPAAAFIWRSSGNILAAWFRSRLTLVSTGIARPQQRDSKACRLSRKRPNMGSSLPDLLRVNALELKNLQSRRSPGDARKTVV
jgi:hypothetical protein